MKTLALLFLGVLLVLSSSCEKESDETIDRIKEAQLPDTVGRNEPFKALIIFEKHCSSNHRFTYDVFPDTAKILLWSTRREKCTTGPDIIDTIHLSLTFNKTGMQYFMINDKNLYTHQDKEFIDSVYVQ